MILNIKGCQIFLKVWQRASKANGFWDLNINRPLILSKKSHNEAHQPWRQPPSRLPASNNQPAPVAIDTERGASFALRATSAISKPSARSSHHHCYVILPMSYHGHSWSPTATTYFTFTFRGLWESTGSYPANQVSQNYFFSLLVLLLHLIRVQCNKGLMHSFYLLYTLLVMFGVYSPPQRYLNRRGIYNVNIHLDVFRCEVCFFWCAILCHLQLYEPI